MAAEDNAAQTIPPTDVRLIGRYALHGELASGGMAAVHLGRLLGPVGFSRTVAIKRLHSQNARDPEFVAMFLDEARLVSRIKHPNVVPTLDVVTLEGEVFLVMEYVHGAPVSRIMMALGKRKERMPINTAVGIALGMLEGLHAAHEAKNEDGVPLGIVHRDVSPQNVIVGTDGVARVLDFGIAKAAERLQQTEDGSFKGKLGYMPPDVLSGAPVDRRADLWGVAVVLWEMLIGKRLFFNSESPHALVRMIVEGEVMAPGTRREGVSKDLDEVILKALSKDANDRFQTAREFALALEDAARPLSNRAIGEWLNVLMADELEQRAEAIEQMERATKLHPPSIGTVRTMAMTESGQASTLQSTTTNSQPPPSFAPASHRSDGSRRDLTGPQPVSSSVEIALPIRPAPYGKIAVVVALLLLGVVVFLLLRPAPSSTIATKRVESATPIASVPPVPSAAPLPSAAPAPPVSAEAAPVHSAAPTPKPTGQKPPASKPPSCNPPYTIGPPPDYIRKPKLECLPR